MEIHLKSHKFNFELDVMFIIWKSHKLHYIKQKNANPDYETFFFILMEETKSRKTRIKISFKLKK